ncbi:MAG: hypothetical protein M3Y06_10915 [Actinomycetota bacterium]|nr:hypothetical protein [Actinomycetota bacterium]
MTGPSSPRDGKWSPQNAGDADGWGPSTAVQAGSGRRVDRVFEDQPLRSKPDQRTPKKQPGRPVPADRYSAPAFDDNWSPAGPAPRDQQRTNRAAERRTEGSVHELDVPPAYGQRAPERGLPWWAALAALILIAAAGGVIDTVGSLNARGGFNIGIVAASVVAVLIVKRSHLFPIVIAPPIVYSMGAAFQLYLRSNGLSDRRAVFDAAANYLVYGFPAIAAATAAVLIIAGIRLIIRK